MAFAGGGGRGSVRSDINITPLVDVVLVLLIIFMVMTPMLLKQMEIKVPEKAQDVEVVPPQVQSQVVLKIDGEGKLYLNNEGLPREKLDDKMREVFANRSSKVLFFDIDDHANYGFVTEVMDVCRGAGVKTLGMMTK